MDKEFRSLGTIQLRACGAEDEKKYLEGRAIPFNIPSKNREGFVEVILPEAVDGVFERSDVYMLFNHNREEGFMARNKRGKGSLNIDVKEDGVYFNFLVASDKLSRSVYEKVCRGDIDETSWAFSVAEDKWERQPDGTYVRTIMKFDQIYDFSIVENSYYGIDDVVSAGCKRYAEIQEADKKAFEEAKAAEERAEKEKAEQEEAERIGAYYEKIKEENAKYLP